MLYKTADLKKKKHHLNKYNLYWITRWWSYCRLSEKEIRSCIDFGGVAQNYSGPGGSIATAGLNSALAIDLFKKLGLPHQWLPLTFCPV